ncbi:MAG: hypothetical protein ACI9XO_002921, partial [Paraglaciecola sp.]
KYVFKRWFSWITCIKVRTFYAFQNKKSRQKIIPDGFFVL